MGRMTGAKPVIGIGVGFHHAGGGGSASFTSLPPSADGMGAEVALTAVDACRGGKSRPRRAPPRRRRGPAYGTGRELDECCVGPHVLLGHSNGAIRRILVAQQTYLTRTAKRRRRVYRRVLPAPPRHIPLTPGDLHLLGDHELDEERWGLARYGGFRRKS